jgi:hypothetical protein
LGSDPAGRAFFSRKPPLKDRRDAPCCCKIAYRKIVRRMKTTAALRAEAAALRKRAGVESDAHAAQALIALAEELAKQADELDERSR